MSESSFPSTLKGGCFSEVKVAHCDLSESQQQVCECADGWNVGIARKQHCIPDVFELFSAIPQAGAMMIVAPEEELKRLGDRSTLPHTDDGFMTRRLKNIHIANPEFKRVFTDFTSHSETDRWPEDYPNEEARNLPSEVSVRSLQKFQATRGHLKVFDGKAWHRLCHDQPEVMDWPLLRERLLAPSESEHHDLGLPNWEQVSKGEEGEFTSAIKDKLVNASGCPVLHLQQVRGQPKDGAILITDKGYRVKCAVKLIGLPEAGLSWKGVGTRHEAALQAASFMRKCIVFIRSDAGSVHVLCKSENASRPAILHIDASPDRQTDSGMLAPKAGVPTVTAPEVDITALSLPSSEMSGYIKCQDSANVTLAPKADGVPTVTAPEVDITPDLFRQSLQHYDGPAMEDRPSFVVHEGKEVPTGVLGWGFGPASPLNNPIFAAARSLLPDLQYAKDPADGVAKMSPVSGWGNAGRTFIFAVLKICKEKAATAKIVELVDEVKICKEKAATAKIVELVDEVIAWMNANPDFDEKMVTAIKLQELKKTCTGAADAMWDADRMQGTWTPTNEGCVLTGTECLLRFKRCSGNFSESAPFIDIWFLLAKFPEEFDELKKQREVPLRNEFIQMLLSYNCPAFGPSLNLPKSSHYTIISNDLQTLDASALKKIVYETLEAGPLSVEFKKQVEAIRQLPHGNLISLGLDDCTNHSETHNLAEVGPLFVDKLYNFAKLDGDEMAYMTSSFSKAGFPNKDKFAKVQIEGSEENIKWKAEVDLMAANLKKIAGTFDIEFSLDTAKPHNLYFMKRLYSQHGILVMGGGHETKIREGEEVIPVEMNWTRFVLQGHEFGAGAYPMEVYQKALEMASQATYCQQLM